MISLSIKSRKDLFMANQNTNSKQGFTIIEVVLVLAIAGLIFLMVFVALPALQRSQRDTARRNDMSRVDTSLVQYQTNNSNKSKSNYSIEGLKIIKIIYTGSLESPQANIKRNCLKGNYVVKPNKEPDLEGKYLIKRSSLKLYDFLEDSERRAMDKEVKKLFHNKEEERLYVVASDRGKEFIYRYLKLFRLTEGMNCRELRSFLELIPLKNPKLKVSYAAFHSKRKKYQTEGMLGIFPKYFMPDNKSEEPKVRRNLNRLPKVYNLATTEQIEIIYKCFCFGIPASQTAKIANMGNTTTETFYQYIRAKIFDKQYQELSVHFESDPQVPQVRIFMNDVSICLYCYNDNIFITQKPLKSKLSQRRQQPEEVKEARRMYNILYRKKFMASMRKYLDHHLAVFLWKEQSFR